MKCKEGEREREGGLEEKSEVQKSGRTENLDAALKKRETCLKKESENASSDL